MTAHAMAGDEEKSLAAGMNGHVTKPIDPDQLFATLKKWIQPGQRPVPAQPSQFSAEQPESSATAPATDEFPEYLPGFDLTDGLKRLQGNTALYRRLLINFAADYCQVADEIRQALDTEDFENAHSLVHNLKGLAGNLAATSLQAAAVNLEKLVKGARQKTPPPTELNLKFSGLEDAFNQALESARSFDASAEENLGELSGEALAAIPAEFAKDLASRLRNAAEMGDVMTLNGIAAEIKTHSDSFKPLSQQIVQMIEGFDLEGIQKLADKLDDR